VAKEIGYQTSTLPSWAALAGVANETNPQLVWPLSIEAYDKMRREEPQVVSVLRAVMLPILSAQYQLDPGEAREEVVTRLAADLGLTIKGRDPVPPHRTRGRFSWREYLRLALLSLVYGHSVFEQVYEPDAFGLLRLKKLAWRPPRTISQFLVAPDGGLEAITQHGLLSGQRGGVKIPVSHLVVHVNEREGANWIGQSLLRSAYKMCILKDRVLRVQTMSIERNGLGVPVYTSAPVPDGADPDRHKEWVESEKDAGLQIAQDFRAGDDSGASIPHGAKLELLALTGKLPDTTRPLQYFDEQIARAVLAHVLNLGGDDSTGSYALGDTLESIFTNSLNSVAADFVDVTQQHVIEDYVDLNRGPDEPAPRLVVSKIGADTPVTADAIRALVDARVITPDEALEGHVRELMGLPARLAEIIPDPAEPAVTPAGADQLFAEMKAATDAEQARFAAETLQKAYLGVGKVLTRREIRELVRRAGADIDPDATPDPEPAPAPVAPEEEHA
jgi:phage gp29-like protein